VSFSSCTVTPLKSTCFTRRQHCSTCAAGARQRLSRRVRLFGRNPQRQPEAHSPQSSPQPTAHTHLLVLAAANANDGHTREVVVVRNCSTGAARGSAVCADDAPAALLQQQRVPRRRHAQPPHTCKVGRSRRERCVAGVQLDAGAYRCWQRRAWSAAEEGLNDTAGARSSGVRQPTTTAAHAPTDSCALPSLVTTRRMKYLIVGAVAGCVSNWRPAGVRGSSWRAHLLLTRTIALRRLRNGRRLR
jgi:hypothetical protein